MKLQVETGFVNSLLKFTSQILSIQNNAETSRNKVLIGSAQNHITKKLENKRSGMFQNMISIPRDQVCKSLKSGLPEILPELA
jgi:predicted transcriptional regulator